jgi:hypothetical protein
LGDFLHTFFQSFFAQMNRLDVDERFQIAAGLAFVAFVKFEFFDARRGAVFAERGGEWFGRLDIDDCPTSTPPAHPACLHYRKEGG